jgi:hypothetical protein
MTPEQEAELIEEIAAEICYAAFVPPIDYGGSKRYWKGVVEAKKEAYRREARAALRIAKPIIRADALEEALSEAEDEAQRTGEGDGEFYIARKIVDRIDALKSKGQKP